MSDPWNLAILLVPASWVYMNHYYGKVHGQRLRWPWFWAAHGALLFGHRLRAWERTPQKPSYAREDDHA